MPANRMKPKTGIPKPPPVRRMVNHKERPSMPRPLPPIKESSPRLISNTHDKFNWPCAIYGWCFASVFWGACFHLWGG